VRCLILSALLFAASVILKVFLLILITAPVLAFFSVLTSLHFIFYLRRRERCIKRVSGESRRRFISTAFKLVAGLALYTMIGRIPEVIAKPERPEQLDERERIELIGTAEKSIDYANVMNRMKAKGFKISGKEEAFRLGDRRVLVIPFEGAFVVYVLWNDGYAETYAYIIDKENKKILLDSFSRSGVLTVFSELDDPPSCYDCSSQGCVPCCSQQITCSPSRYPSCRELCGQLDYWCLIACGVGIPSCAVACTSCIVSGASCEACIACAISSSPCLKGCCVGGLYCACRCIPYG
jgi:hypothetical protein